LLHFYSCTTISEKQICLEIQNQYWLDLDSTSLFIAFYEADTVFIKSSEISFLQQYQKCENNILYSFYDKELSDTFGVQKLRMSGDTLILEVVSSDFTKNGYLSKMKRITKENANNLLLSNTQDTIIEIKDSATVKVPR